MQSFSIVIICKNEEENIADTLSSVEGLTDDVVVLDNGSTDSTVEIIKRFPVNLYQRNWEGYGKTKRTAVNLAKNDWIFFLDADESADQELRDFLRMLEPGDNHNIYRVKFRNFLGKKELRYGEWGRHSKLCVFNRKKVNWNDAEVHEELELPKDAIIIKARGRVLHRTVKDLDDYARKTVHYAMLSAEKYFRQGKKISWLKLRLAPGFAFIQFYLLRRGFLDGHEGYVCAKMTAWYTFLKYNRLKELWQSVPS